MRGVLQGAENATAGDPNGIFPATFPDPITIGLAVLVLGIGWGLSKLVVRLTGRMIARRIERPSVTRTALRGVRLSVLLVTAGIAAGILGFSGTDILLSVTVISAVVAVVLAPLVGSLINGLFVLSDRPYEIGDMIEITDEGHRGFVEDITIRYTKIFTLQNTFIVIPNSNIQERDVVNYSAEDERTRVSVTFAVTYESDLEAARRAAERAARNVDNVITGGPDIRVGSERYPAAPTCLIDQYGDDGVLLELFFWLNHPFRERANKSAVQAAVRERFADLDVEFAYPRRHHVFDTTSGVASVAIEDGPARHSDARPSVDATDATDETVERE
ncbi:mechanosensitive ion channel family protein [Halopiger goleimassiliensis]|uniref:mechanosensitive ion channel family protein n=1 Tax=Halopiger goleimassiliensis TaxID=1293048 RepID=UPI000677710B|nr:mechanosensitive ion channel family protein [Halopiger goleimassiliensis]